MNRCYICNNSLIGNHLKYCAKINNLTYTDEIKFNQIKFLSKIDFNKEMIVDLYQNQEESILEISKILGVSYRNIVFLLNWYGIPQKTLIETLQSKQVKSKRNNTSLIKYGVDNPSKSKIVREKVKSSFIKRYGVDNVFKSKEFKSYLPIRMNELYGKRSLPNRYGNMTKWWSEQSLEFRKNHTIPARNGYKKWWDSLSVEEQEYRNIEKSKYLFTSNKGWSSSLEIRISNILHYYGVDHQQQKWINRKSYDFLIDETNLIIEIQGDFWHGNPKCFKPNDIIPINNGILAKDIWLKDKNKRDLAEKYGYRILYIWEYDMKNMSDFEIFSLIMDNINENKIY